MCATVLHRHLIKVGKHSGNTPVFCKTISVWNVYCAIEKLGQSQTELMALHQIAWVYKGKRSICSSLQSVEQNPTDRHEAGKLNFVDFVLHSYRYFFSCLKFSVYRCRPARRCCRCSFSLRANWLHERLGLQEGLWLHAVKLWLPKL